MAITAAVPAGYDLEKFKGSNPEDRLLTFYKDITFDSSYPTGGEPLVNSTVAVFPELKSVLGIVMVSGTMPYEIRLDRTNQKIKVLTVDRGADLTVDNNNPLVELPAATDLSSYTIGVIVYGTRVR